MEKYIFYACTGEEQVRYACENIISMQGLPIERNMGALTEQLLSDCGVVAFSDRASELWGGGGLYGLPIISPKELINQEFDYIYILNMMSWETIKYDLINKCGIPADKIITEPMRLHALTRARFVQMVAENQRNRGIFGSVAEGGVFRGDFAKVINANYKSSNLYLFDTFSGFDSRDVLSDDIYSKTANPHNHLADTSVQTVLDKLPYPDKVIIRKGYFPETSKDIDDFFVFVNLDFDLYAPIKAGLEFFFPKLLNGGVILVHDYFNSNYDARKAVDEFCEANNLFIMSIGDLLSVAIVKQ